MVRPGSPAVSVIIPAWNEEALVGETVRAVRAAGFADEVIVVDDGSCDGTARAAAAAGAAVLRLERNGGKGRAMNRGAAVARGQVLVFLDADLGATAGEGARLVEPLRRGEADMAVAVFPRRPGRRGFGLAVGAARWGAAVLAGVRLGAPLSGQRAIRREVFFAVGGCDAGFGAEVGLAIDVARAGYRTVEVPCAMDHAVTGWDLRGVLHRGRQLGAVLRALWRRGLPLALVRRVAGARRAGAGVPRG